MMVAQRGGQQNVTLPPQNMPRAPQITQERVSGTLLRLDFVELVMQATDRRAIQMTRPADLKVTRRNEDGHNSAVTEKAFEPGDQVTVEASREQNRYHADRLRLDGKGGEEEKKAALETLDDAFGTGMTTEAVFGMKSGDPVIDAARSATVQLTRSLPNFMVHQVTTRYVNGPTDLKHKGQKLDQVDADLVTENGTETFQNMLVNGKKPKQAPEKTGAWSSGEYSSIVIEVLAPRTRTAFEARGPETFAGRQCWRYSFAVDEGHSHWILGAAGQRYLPAYRGVIWFDQETSRVLKVEISSREMPRLFPIDKVISTVEYDFIALGDTKYLLPARAESINCSPGRTGCARNQIEFKGYRKFGAESSISFDRDPR